MVRDGVVAGGGSDGRLGNSGAMARIRSVLSAVGAVLTGTGVLILLFVAYQLWGTGLYTARAQDALKDEFEAKIAAPGPDTTTAATAAATTTTNAVASVAAPPPPSGEAVAVVRIPRIGVNQAVVEGVSVADLRKGPGHYPSTPLPGEAGNAAIAGHRTTYGAPFNRLDELADGDEILVTTERGNSTYRVLEKKIVRPDQVEVLDPTPEPRLTLTTCHPKYSAAKRLIVVAGLAPGEAAPPPSPAPHATATGPETNPADQLADAGLATDRSTLPTVTWGAATALVGAAWWWAVRRRRHWTTYLTGALGFLAVLFVFYAHLELLLPANF